MYAKHEAATQCAKSLLMGCHLEHYQVWSAVMVMSFIRNPRAPDLPDRVWVVASCDLSLAKTNAPEYKPTGTYQEMRRAFIADAWPAIGHDVTAVSVFTDGHLVIELESFHLHALRSVDPFEEEWCITSMFPDSLGVAPWNVALSDFGEFEVRRP